MTVPTEADFMIVKPGIGTSPVVYNAICGIENVSINKTVSATDRYRRDCATLGLPAIRKNVITGKAMTVSANGAANVSNISVFETLLGIVKPYKIELYSRDGTDTGALIGTYAGNFVMVTDNVSTDPNGNSSGEIALNSDGAWTYTAAS